MCLLSVGLDTLALLLRVWLWISVPIGVIILCVATWLNYLRTSRAKGSLRMAVEGLVGEAPFGAGERNGAESFGAGESEGDRLIGRDDIVGEGSESATGVERAGVVEESDREELTATGRETIYQGILWMKEKYEQYREQADQRYELLREELRRSERRYQELMVVVEQNKTQTLGTVIDKSESETAKIEEVGVTGVGMADTTLVDDPKQRIIEDLEVQLRTERLKVGELVRKLQANSELIMRIYKELESIPDLGK